MPTAAGGTPTLPQAPASPSRPPPGTPPDPPDGILLLSNASGAPVARLASIDPEDKARAHPPVIRHRTGVLDDVFLHTAPPKDERRARFRTHPPIG